MKSHNPATDRSNGDAKGLLADVPLFDLIGAAVMFCLGVTLLVRAFA